MSDRLHVWDPAYSVGDPPVYDHPYDFTSTIIVGELTNTRYEEDPAGDEYLRFRYTRPTEDLRASDTVRLSATATTFTAGGQYGQLAHELHTSWQLPGTVIRCSWVEVPRSQRLRSRCELVALGTSTRRDTRRDQDGGLQSSGVVLRERFWGGFIGRVPDSCSGR